jgi:organic radical activating enzyme
VKRCLSDYTKQTRTHSLKRFDGRDSKRFHWNLITMCNYKCDYCYSRESKSQWNGITDSNTIDNVLDSLGRVDGVKEVFVLGGEPTLHPKYFRVMDALNEMDGVEAFGNITNGYYKDYVTFVDGHKNYKEKFYWNVTFHPSQVEDVDYFKQTIQYIKDSGYIININILLDDRFKEHNNDVMYYCNENDIPFYPSFVFSNNEFSVVDDVEWLNHINDNYQPVKELFYHADNSVENYNDIDVYLRGLYKFRGWSCINNSFVIPIKDSRFLQFCTDTWFTVEEINDFDGKVVCPLDNCICPARLGDEKFRITS